MWIMTTGATHLAFTKRHMGEAHLLGDLPLMALVAELHLRRLREQFGIQLPTFVYTVATCAWHIAHLMRTPVPSKAFDLLMALQAGLISLLNRRRTPFGETNQAVEFLAL